MKPAIPSTAQPAQELMMTVRELGLWGLFFLGHVMLALVMQRIPQVGMMHAIGCIVLGLVVAARRPRHETAYVVAYIAGSEVLWRMTRAGVFWEFGKYAVALVLLVALIRTHGKRNRGLAFGYFALLLPSAVLTFLSLPFNVARMQVSFNLSGPLALMLSALWFSNLKLSPDEIRRTLLSLIAPVIGIAAIAYFSTVTAVNLEFSGEANSTTSGGFGPNQVSAMLGLTILFLLLILLDRRLVWRLKWPFLILAILVAIQAALTFSRGGLAMVFGSAMVMGLYLIRQRRTRITFVILATLLFSLGKYVIIPRLDAFTSGRFTERYTSAKTSNRVDLASYDLEIFFENPVLGVGPGVASGLRGEIHLAGAAHTEFTRMLSEHGILGILSMLLLIVLSIRTVLNARTLAARALTSALVTWFGLFLLVNAMRLAAPAFVFGLACAIAYSSFPRPPPRA